MMEATRVLLPFNAISTTCSVCWTGLVCNKHALYIVARVTHSSCVYVCIFNDIVWLEVQSHSVSQA